MVLPTSVKPDFCDFSKQYGLLCQVDQAGLQAIEVVVPYAVKHLLHLGKDLGARYDDLGCIVNPTVRKGWRIF